VARNKVLPSSNTLDVPKSNTNAPFNRNNNDDERDHEPECHSDREIPLVSEKDDTNATDNSEEDKKSVVDCIMKVKSGIHDTGIDNAIDPRESERLQAEIERKHGENLLSLAEKNGTDNEANTIKQSVIAVIMLVCYFGFGMIFYSKTFKISYFRALYFNIITVTTIGYGEISPDTDFTKLITAVNIFAGLAIFTIAITFLLDFFAKEKEILDELLIARKFEEENKIEMDVKSGAEDNVHNSNVEEEESFVKSKSMLMTKYNCCVNYIPEQIRDAMYSMLMAVITIVATDLIGAIFFMYVVEDFTFVDSVYFCAVTISSVGYGM
jgi:hypothetical protein